MLLYGKNINKWYKRNKSKILHPARNEECELSDGSVVLNIS